MGFFKEKTNNETKQSLVITIDSTNLDNILNTEVLQLFPKTGEWKCTCFEPNECRDIGMGNLPCNLYDEKWLSKLFDKRLQENKYDIPFKYIEHYVHNSNIFKEQLHNYTLEIVKWQINWMMHNGDNWLVPDGFNELFWKAEKDCDKCFRLAVLETLSAIGLKPEDIEEGLEKNANLWRDQMMNLAFSNEFTPNLMILHLQNININGNNNSALKMLNKLKSPDKLHKDSWILLRKINYYKEHKAVLDKFDLATPEMKMNGESLEKAVETFTKIRKKEIADIVKKINLLNNNSSVNKDICK